MPAFGKLKEEFTIQDYDWSELDSFKIPDSISVFSFILSPDDADIYFTYYMEDESGVGILNTSSTEFSLHPIFTYKTYLKLYARAINSSDSLLTFYEFFSNKGNTYIFSLTEKTYKLFETEAIGTNWSFIDANKLCYIKNKEVYLYNIETDVKEVIYSAGENEIIQDVKWLPDSETLVLLQTITSPKNKIKIKFTRKYLDLRTKKDTLESKGIWQYFDVAPVLSSH